MRLRLLALMAAIPAMLAVDAVRADTVVAALTELHAGEAEPQLLPAGLASADLGRYRALFALQGPLLLGCMMITASLELAPGGMLETVLRQTAQMSGTAILVYGSALMFVLRFFAGPIAHKLSPIGMMAVSVTLTGIGLFLLSTVTSAGLAYLAATVFYLGTCFMWPTMLGITSERFPQGGAFTMGLMGFAGQFMLGIVIFQMGKIIDRLGAAASFRYVAMLAAIPLIVFALWWIKDQAKGGYKAVKLDQQS